VKLASGRILIVGGQTTKAKPVIPREQLAPRFRDLTEEDLTTPTAVIQAIRR